MPFEASRSALVIVDMQRYWTDPAGPMAELLEARFPDLHAYFYRRLKQTVVPTLAKVLDAYRSVDLPAVHFTSGPARADGKDLPAHLQRRIASGERVSANFHLIKVGSEWHEIAPELLPFDGEIVLNKTTRSGFNSTGIDRILRALGVSHMVVAGLATNACVELTARDAADLGYETALLEDGCVTFTEEAHVSAFRTCAQTWGSVLQSVDVVRAIDELRVERRAMHA